MKFSVKERAIISLCIVAFSYSLLNVSIRLLNSGFGPFSQVYLRICLGLILTIILFFREISLSKIKKISSKDWFILFLMGTIGYGVAVDFATLGVLHTNLLNVAVIGSTTPFFIFLFSVIFLQKSFSKSLLFFLLLSFYGICVLATNSLLPVLNHFASGDFYILLFAMGIGVYILGRKFLSSHLNNSEIAVIVMFFAFISSLIIAIGKGEALHLAGFENPTALLGLFLGGTLNLVATKLENFGFHNLSAVTGSQIMLLENIFSPLLGFILYSETISLVEFVGAVVVLTGVWFYIKHERG
jgi:drug/metabolite transporter (DMT)-like permease